MGAKGNALDLLPRLRRGYNIDFLLPSTGFASIDDVERRDALPQITYYSSLLTLWRLAGENS